MNKSKIPGFYFKLAVAQSYNQLIYLLQKLPLVGKYISNRVYGAQTAKSVLLIIGILVLLVKAVLYKIIYFGALFLVANLLGDNLRKLLAHQWAVENLFFLLLAGFSLIIGSVLRSNLIKSGDREQVIAIKIFNLPAKNYLLINQAVDLGIFFLTYGLILSSFTFWITDSFFRAWSFTSLLVGVRLGLSYAYLSLYRPHTKEPNKHLVHVFLTGSLMGFVLMILSYGLNWTFLPSVVTSPWSGLLGLVLILVSWLALKGTDRLDQLARQLLTVASLKGLTPTDINTQGLIVKEDEYDLGDPKSQSGSGPRPRGIAYLNQIFYQRFSSYFRKKMRLRFLILGAIMVSVNLLFFFGADLKTDGYQGSEWLFRLLFPITVALSYFFYSSEYYTKFCFYQMDRHLLKYVFYRQPNQVLTALAIRFRAVVGLHLPLLGVMLVGLYSLYWLIGGRSWFDLVWIFVLQLVLMLFFSCHHLILYYLLQPFTVAMETKSLPYQMINMGLYFFAFQFFRIIEDSSFSIFIGVFFALLVYIIVGLWAVWRFAPQRFRLR